MSNEPRHGGFPDDRPPKRNPFDGAEAKGRAAFREGKSINDCPYNDIRKANGKLSWSRAWRNAWIMGYQLEQVETKSNAVAKASQD